MVSNLEPNLPYLLDTDASADSVVAVLPQVREEKELVLAYFSAKFSKPEKNHCVTRKELAAVMKSLGPLPPLPVRGQVHDPD